MRIREERWAGDRAGPAPPPAARPAPLQKRRREPREPQDYGAGSVGKGSAAAAGEARLQVSNLGEQSWAAAEGSAEPPASLRRDGAGTGDMETAPGGRRSRGRVPAGLGGAAPGTGTRYVPLPAWVMLTGGISEAPLLPAGSCCPFPIRLSWG